MADNAPIDAHGKGSNRDGRCKTPGCEWYLRAGDRGVCVEVEFPASLDLDMHEAGRLNAAMHHAIEGVLAPYFSECGECLA